MKIDAKYIVELVGIFAVAASLIFVGMQLMLDRRVALGEQYFNRSESLKSDWRTRLESDFYVQTQLEDWENGIRPPFWNAELEEYIKSNNLSYDRVFSRVALDRMMVIHTDNIYFQYQRGLLTDEAWLPIREGVKSSFRNNPIIFALAKEHNNLEWRQLIKQISEELAAEK